MCIRDRLLAVGFIFLVKGADYFVEGSSNIAKLLKVPSIIIGLTIVAMGTSLPEASVSINAAISGANEPVSYTHLDVYKRQVYGPLPHLRLLPDFIKI